MSRPSTSLNRINTAYYKLVSLILDKNTDLETKEFYRNIVILILQQKAYHTKEKLDAKLFNQALRDLNKILNKFHDSNLNL